MATRIHVYPDPDSDGWIWLELTDQEAFEWDREHYGEAVALENWKAMRGPSDQVHVTPEQNEG
jgi:hypothetical protein